MPSSSPEQGYIHSEKLSGTVLAVQANYYQVRLNSCLDYSIPTGLDRSESQPLLLCTRRSRLKKIGQQIMVGDQVLIEEPDWAGMRGAISDVLPRQTELDRPPIANVNQILLVFALADPPLDAYQLSRFLVRAELTGIKIGLCLSKSDLVSLEQQRRWQERLQTWGYAAFTVSLHTNQGLESLNHYLHQSITVIAGPSGVGKSSLINHFIPTAKVKVGAVSGKLSRGRHTTRHVELFEIPNGGFLADTPGFNQPDLKGSPALLASCFPELRQRLMKQHCQFSNCLHQDEPNCAVVKDWERYEHYLSFLEILQQQQPRRAENTEPRVKSKIKSSGNLQYEPRLALKKYRQPSRRSQQQALQDLYRESQ
jgi:ribosome biogenesis GTPase